MSNVIVIGGGAAGMMAAIAAAEKGHTVTLYERNEKLGKKVYITGKGRCNLTNACEVEDFFGQVVTNPKFLYSACYSFDSQAIVNLIESEGIKTKVERGERVFPLSDHASDVIHALQNRLHKNGVKIVLNTFVQSLWIEDGILKGIIIGKNQKIEADAVIMANGGKSYPVTGSDGNGYQMARNAGHQVTEILPALVPLETKELWCTSLQGLSLKNVRISLVKAGKTLYEEMGEMLFTHFGVSGPLILSASSYLAANSGKEKKTGASQDTMLYLDLKPALDEETLDHRILKDFEENQNKAFKNAVSKLFPIKMIPVMVELSEINPEKKVNEISREARLRFVRLIKKIPITVKGTREFNEAIITHGGISVREVNPSTMESKLIKNLFFAGEILDVDALTGGFNLQIAWATGHLAGDEIR